MERETEPFFQIEPTKENMPNRVNIEISKGPDVATQEAINARMRADLERLKQKVIERRENQKNIAAVMVAIAIGGVMATKEVLASIDSEGKDALAGLEIAPDAKAKIDYESLQEFDPELDRKRVDVILDTLPKGFVTGEISLIEFNRNADTAMGDEYGKKKDDNSKAVASTKGGWKKTGAKITFLATSESKSSAYNVKTLIHEIGHANAFDTLRNLSDSDRVALEKKIIIRLEDPNRFKSAYVEGIENENQAEEQKVKENEYWAEIFEAYINKNVNLPVEDSVLVAEVIALKDPNFDRDEQLRRRNIEVMEMMDGELKTELNNLSSVMQGRHQAWLENHKDKIGQAIDQKKQKVGRAELFSFLKSSLTDEDQAAFIGQYISFCEEREKLLSEGGSADLGELLSYAKFVEEKIPKSLGPEKAKELLDKVDAIINKYDLVIGKHRGVDISPEEQQELTSAKNKKILSIVYNLLSEFNS